jgi:hypothetical protein
MFRALGANRYWRVDLVVGDDPMGIGKRRGATSGEQPTLEIPFHLRGYDGSVAVYYGVNRDPHLTGFDLLNLSFDLALTIGYPTLRATIDYDGPGYRAYMGWVQLITNRDPATGAAEVGVDLSPIHEDLESPFAEYGAPPTFFDAPANPDHETEDWIADTFLAVCPDIARTRRVAALLGFRWGYALRERHPTPLPLERTGVAVWDQHLSVLRERFPSWEFLPGYATDL